MSKFGQIIHRYKSVSSTNDLAIALAERGEKEGTVVLANAQSRGRGRRRRHWISPEDGGIWMSLILRPKVSSKEASQITLMAAVAVVKALRNYLALEAKIKWPNDILIKDKKISGILTEIGINSQKIKYVIVGIGLNTNLDLDKLPKNLKNRVTSLNREFSGKWSKESLIKELIKQLEESYHLFKKEGFSAVREEWKIYSAILGRQIEAKYQGEKTLGQAVGLTDEGALLLRRDTGIVEELSVSDIKIVN